MVRLKDRWKEIWQKLGVEVQQTALEELIQAYSSTGRFYHNLAHIVDCISIFDRTKSLAAHPEEVELAIWFHDAIYDTRREDNEQKSAAWAGKVICQSGLGIDVAERVSEAILATRHPAEVQGTDARLMADVDLSIFGAEPDIFWRYEEGIRKEYAWVPEDLFRHKRAEILRGFISRPYIYYHQPYREAFEAKARVHLKQAIERLEG